jgi:predicted nucleic acid-binding protein
MAGLYVDTSALGRVLLGEPDARAIRNALAGYDAWWSSRLLVVELRRLAKRVSLEPPAEHMLSQVRFLDIGNAALERASRLGPVDLRSLDAIHLDAALTLARNDDVGAVLTFDHRLQAACAHHGLAVESPSAS